MQTAQTFAKLSPAQRLKVGAIAVKDGRIISIGYNGTPSGWDNTCEDREYADTISLANMKDYPFSDTNKKRYRLKTKPEVIHAEANCIAKLAASNESGKGAEMYVTHSPCLECAKQIYTAGISKVYYKEFYRSDEGINFLKKCNIEVEQI